MTERQKALREAYLMDMKADEKHPEWADAFDELAYTDLEYPERKAGGDGMLEPVYHGVKFHKDKEKTYKRIAELAKELSVVCESVLDVEREPAHKDYSPCGIVKVRFAEVVLDGKAKELFNKMSDLADSVTLSFYNETDLGFGFAVYDIWTE